MGIIGLMTVTFIITFFLIIIFLIVKNIKK